MNNGKVANGSNELFQLAERRHDLVTRYLESVGHLPAFRQAQILASHIALEDLEKIVESQEADTEPGVDGDCSPHQDNGDEYGR